MRFDYLLVGCLLLVLFAGCVCFAETTDKPVLCRTVECDSNDGQNGETKDAAAEDARQTYIVVFKLTDSSATVSAKELLDAFNKNLPQSARTHHFRQKSIEGQSVGQICVDGKAGKETIVEMIAKNRNLILVSAEPAAAEQLKELGITVAPPKRPVAADSKDKLSFVLPDSLGREIRSQDYAGVPVLIMAGSCWCGGCQQDAEPLRKIAEEYMPKGLAVLRSVSGDNELAAIDFANHYRLAVPQLMDTNRDFERRYNPDGWTFLMLADGEGKIVYKCNSPEEKDWIRIKELIGQMLKGELAKSISLDGVNYMPPTLHRSGETSVAKRRDRFASIACAGDGRVYVVFTSNRNGNNDIFIRVFDGNNWSEDKPIAATKADEYDGTVVVDKDNRIWVGWTSNASGKYGVYTEKVDLSTPEPNLVSGAGDDVMHGRMACDEKGRIWITYYKWQNMGDKSRDKEVYVRRFEDGRLSREVQVSPTDVPDYEDHTEPVIAAYGDGAIVCWSWDFHQPAGYTKEAALPTIFVRRVDNDFEMSKASVVSAKDTDVTPSIAVIAKDQIWCAWDSMSWQEKSKVYRKQVCLKQATVTGPGNTDGILAVTEPVMNVCTPTVAVGKGGVASLVWSETANGSKWALKKADYDPAGKRWLNAKVVETKGNPRYCSAGFDGEGRLWVGYSVETEKGREVIMKRLDASAKTMTSDAAQTNTPQPASGKNVSAVAELRRVIDECYSYRDLRDVNWTRQFSIYGPVMEQAQTPEKFAEIAATLLEAAQDPHVWVKIGGKSFGGFKRSAERNYDMATLQRLVPDFSKRNNRVSTGRFEDGIGYVLINNWAKERDSLEPAFEALKQFADTPGLIIDVRPNAGGSEPLAQEFAGCFIDKPVVYSKDVYRKVGEPNGFGPVFERILEPNKQRPRFKGKVAVLMGQVNMSSCESFLLMMKQGPDCKLIGQKSYGSSGNPKPYDLGNGVTVWLPSWKDLFPDGTCLEGRGVLPDIPVSTTDAQFNSGDPVLEAGLKYLRGQ